MLNKNFILSRIYPFLNKNNELSEAQFFELFGNLEQKEQYEIINIMIDNNIDYVEEKEEESSLSYVTEYRDLKHISNEMLCHMAQNGDQSATAALIENNKLFIYKIALQINYSFNQHSLSMDDLFQEGCLGVLEAIKNFDITKDNKFITYSWYWIKQRITRAIMDTGFIIRIPVHKFEKMIRILNCLKQNQNATHKELSFILETISENEVLELLSIYENYLNTTSLNLLIDEDSTTELRELLPYEPDITLEDKIIYNSLKTELNNVLSTLNSREQRILELRFGILDGKEHTLEEIGSIYKVTRERIRQIEAKAFKKLRHPSRANRIKDFID